MPEDQPQPPRPRPEGDGGPPRPPVRMSRGLFSWLVIAGLAVVLLLMLQQSMHRVYKLPSISLFWNYIRNGDIQKVVVKENMITGEFYEDRKPANAPQDTRQFEVEYLGVVQKIEEVRKEIDQLTPKGRRVDFTTQGSNNLITNVLLGVVPWLLIIGVIWLLLFRQLRQTGGGAGVLGNFGRSRHTHHDQGAHVGHFRRRRRRRGGEGGSARDRRVPQEPQALRPPRRAHPARRAARRRAGLRQDACWPRRSPAKPTCRSSRSPAATSSRCSWASARPACATCSVRRKRIRPASSSWTRSTPSAGAAAWATTAAATTSASRRSTRSWWRWTASTPTTR